MNSETHRQLAGFIWQICNLLRGPYKRSGESKIRRKGKVQLIGARNHWVPMEKSLGNKRRRIGDPTDDKPKDPDHIGDIATLHGKFGEEGEDARWVLFDRDGKSISVSATAPAGEPQEGQTWEQRVASKVFDNEDFGYHKITVERPLRDTENVPLKESLHAYFEREVLPHVPDAWIDHGKTKVGYEIPLNRHFCRHEPPRELSVIEGEIKALEQNIVRLLGEVTA